MRSIIKGRVFTITLLLLCVSGNIFAQNAKAKANSSDVEPVQVILMIGDGMGLAQIHAGLTANKGNLNILQFRNIGFSRTQSASHYVTDSGAGGTALSTGNKTYNGAIGVKADSLPCKTILEYAEINGLATGLVSSSAITHATPASFIAHNINRNNYDEIALDFLKTDIDVFIGGGRDNFVNRKDKKNLVADLRRNDYKVIYSADSISLFHSGKLAALTAPDHNPTIHQGRGEYIRNATLTAIDILDDNPKGFFLMVEGSLIDYGCHGNDVVMVAEEVIDFDKAVGAALDYARNHKNTIVIVIADHETGGLAINNGDFADGTVKASFSTTAHTGIMVPVYAYGPGSEVFQGFQENTDIFHKIMNILGIEESE